MRHGFFPSCVALLLGLLSLAGPASAHTSSHATLRFASDATPSTWEWQAAWRDLDALLDLDANGDGALSAAEARAGEARLVALAAQAFDWQGAPGCTVQWRLAGSTQRAGLGHARLAGQAQCPEGQAFVPQFTYRFLEGIDPSHRLFVQGPVPEPAQGPHVLAAGEAFRGAQAPAPPSLLAFFVDGMVHILKGLDHVIFVLTLVLPVALAVQASQQRQALRRLLWVVTAFTLAHSLTLAMASLRLWAPPADIVEPAIAASIALAAGANLVWRRVHASSVLAFGLGLLHGFGFAEVLVPLELPPATLAAALASFNLGVEAGQLLIVLPALGLLQALARRRQAWGRRVHDAGSAGFAVLGLMWFVQRVV
jgi:hypothetical protein